MHELRVAIDAARAQVFPDEATLDHIAALVMANERSIMSTHVQYNIGRARREWLAAFIRTRQAKSLRSTTR